MKQTKTATIEQVRAHFALADIAAAWRLVRDMSWRYRQVEGKWWVDVPPDDWEPRW